MRKTILQFTALLIFLNINAQNQKQFVIHETIITDSLQMKTPSDFKRSGNNFFEDQDYIVRKTCSGEWGGSIWFKSKNTGIEYACNATCPIAIYKMNGKYIVINTIAHGCGFSSALEISDPQKMEVFKMPKPKLVVGKKIYRAIGDDESKSRKGVKQIIDTAFVFTLAAFPYNNQLYYIITNFEKTFLAEIKDGKFITLDTISEKSLWTYRPEIIKTNDNHYIVFFDNKEAKGYFDIFETNIDLIIQK